MGRSGLCDSMVGGLTFAFLDGADGIVDLAGDAAIGVVVASSAVAEVASSAIAEVASSAVAKVASLADAGVASLADAGVASLANAGVASLVDIVEAASLVDITSVVTASVVLWDEGNVPSDSVCDDDDYHS